MDEKDTSLQKLKEKYQHKAKAFNEEEDAALSEAIIARSENDRKRISEAEKSSEEMLEKAKSAAKAAVESEDTKSFDEISAVYATFGVRK